MYGIIRYIFCIVLLAVTIIVLKKHNLLKKKTIIAALIVTFVLIESLDFIPIENLFINFSSAESVYKYVNMGEVKYIVDGEKTDLIIGNDIKYKDSERYYITSKTDKGWKINTHSSKGAIATAEGCSLELMTDKKTNDSYVIITSIKQGKLELSDNHNSDFRLIEFDRIFGHTYIAFVGNLDDDYRLTINGNTYKLENMNKTIFNMLPVL